MKEITWYGRGGQGAFTAARVLGTAAMLSGKKSLAFPSFGPERRGAPIRAFTKISEQVIVNRSIPEKNDYILVLDDSLYTPSLQEQLKEGGKIFINTTKPKEVFGTAEYIYTQDITTKANEILGRVIVNIGMIGMLLPDIQEIDLSHVKTAVGLQMPARVVEKNNHLLDAVLEEAFLSKRE